MNAQEIITATQTVANRLKSDVILFNQPIDPQVSDKFHARLESIPKKHTNAFLIFATFGGDAHAAYVIARDLQLRYKEIVVCIAGDCYSAGTLFVCCANELVITDRGRLGPLDVQLVKRDEIGERISGLTVGIALQELQRESFEAFMGFVTNLKEAFGVQLSLKTAMEVATDLTTGVFQEVYRQIDPIRLAEDARYLRIASHYGEILAKASGNLKPNAVDRLLKGYPSHECIIDRTEAGELFKRVRPPEQDEVELLRILGRGATNATFRSDDGLMVVLSELKERGNADENQVPDKLPKRKPERVSGNKS